MHIIILEYYAGDKGGLCKEESNVIRSQTECTKALHDLGYQALNKFSTTNDNNAPSGCSIHIDSLNPLFETSPNGTGNSLNHLTPICAYKGKGTNIVSYL